MDPENPSTGLRNQHRAGERTVRRSTKATFFTELVQVKDGETRRAAAPAKTRPDGLAKGTDCSLRPGDICPVVLDSLRRCAGFDAGTMKTKDLRHQPACA